MKLEDNIKELMAKLKRSVSNHQNQVSDIIKYIYVMSEALNIKIPCLGVSPECLCLKPIQERAESDQKAEALQPNKKTTPGSGGHQTVDNVSDPDLSKDEPKVLKEVWNLKLSSVFGFMLLIWSEKYQRVLKPGEWRVIITAWHYEAGAWHVTVSPARAQRREN